MNLILYLLLLLTPTSNLAQSSASTMNLALSKQFSSPSPYTEEASQKGLEQRDTIEIFHAFLYQNRDGHQKSIQFLKENWDVAYIPLLIDILHMSVDEWLKEEIAGILEQNTKQNYGTDYFQWLQWMWKKEPVYKNFYGDFKSRLYSYIDLPFDQYFRDRHHLTTIRLDEVVWGGVPQDGIPPLRHPDMIAPQEASYLSDTDVVFGVFINGEAKAYPKRILGWHELFIDQIGGREIAGVYCTLCGTVIAYDVEHKGIKHQLGTSGFLYRSNKLMYDEATQSLWSTIEGKPVIGPLVNQDIVLETYSVTTTSWGEWKRRHPDTQVLSLDTGHQRNYNEGAAYQEYYATDRLMFPVAKTDSRLDNKAEVLIIRVPGYRKVPLAISADFLKKRKKRIYQDKIAETPFVVLIEGNGASRVYEGTDIKFDSYKKGILKDRDGQTWTVSENALKSTEGEVLKRLPSHRIFWFAWFNAYPETRLVK